MFLNNFNKVIYSVILAYAIPDMNKIKSTDMTPETESFEEISESDLVELQAHRSPVSNTSDTLTYESLGSQVDENRYGISDETRNTSVTESNSSQKYADDFFHKFTLGTFNYVWQFGCAC